MGSWDVSSFGNEQAESWLVELMCGESAQPVFKALTKAAKTGEKEFLQANDAEIVVAAAEVVASAVGVSSEDVPPELEQWLVNHPVNVGAEIVKLSIRVVERVRDNSELQEVWSETDSNSEWLHAIDDLVARLTSSSVYEQASQAEQAQAHVHEAVGAQGAQTTDFIVQPWQLDDLLEQALRFVSSGDHGAALEKYEEVLHFDPQSQLACLGRATCHLKLKNYTQAVSDINDALECGQDVVEAHYLRAQAHYHLHLYDECLVDANYLVSRQPNEWNGYWIRGMAHEGLALYLKAATDYTRVIELASGFREAYSRRANCYEKLGSHEKANQDRAKFRKEADRV